GTVSPRNISPDAGPVPIVDPVVLGAACDDVAVLLRQVDVVQLRDRKCPGGEGPVRPAIGGAIDAAVVGKEDPARVERIEGDVLLIGMDAGVYRLPVARPP